MPKPKTLLKETKGKKKAKQQVGSRTNTNPIILRLFKFVCATIDMINAAQFIFHFFFIHGFKSSFFEQ